MIIDTILKIDTASFQTGMGRSVQLVQSFIQIGQGIAGKFKSAGEQTLKAFNLGGQLSDVSAQIGETAGEVMVLRRAFGDAGVGADSVGTVVAILNKALAGADEEGKGTAKTFEKLGLDAAALANMSVADRLQTIGGALMGVSDQSDRTALAMSLFGKSGAKLLTLFSDSGAFAGARTSLGGIVSVMDRAAPAFDAISDKVGHIKEKSMGFWAGFAEGVLPAVDSVTSALDSIDLSGLGKKAGDFLSTWVQLFKENDVGEIIRLQLAVGWQKAVDYTVGGIERLSNVMVSAFGAPLVYFRATIQKIIEEVLELVGKIPKLNSILGLKDFKANSFAATLADQTDYALSAAQYGPSVKVYGDTEEQKRLAGLWQKASVSVMTAQKEIEAKAASVKPMSAAVEPVSVAGPSGKESLRKSASMASDQFSRLGLFVGGNSVQTSLLASSRNQETFLKGIRDNTSKLLGGGKAVAVYG